MKSNGENLSIGLASALFAYLVWGLQAVYWKMLSGADPIGIIAHRYIWSLVFLLILVLVTNKKNKLIETTSALFHNRKTLAIFSIATAIGMLNWGINIIAPIQGHVVELGLGLFLTPLMSMALGVVFFGETLSPLKKLSISLATIGFLIMVIRFGSFPWIAFSVSFTWAVYGALRKTIRLDPFIGVLLESIISLPLTLGYLIYLHLTGEGHFLIHGMDTLTLALIGTGLITSIPLIAFMNATNNLPLTLLGLCQYLSPILTLLLGVFIYKEHFGFDELFSMSFIWIGIILFLISEAKARRKIWMTRKHILTKQVA